MVDLLSYSMDILEKVIQTFLILKSVLLVYSMVADEIILDGNKRGN